jgi:mannobiose 2-epimerase
MKIKDTSRLRNEAQYELTRNILPFWMDKAVDKESGGFYGQINGYGQVIKNADKGGIVNARILWTFSAAYNKTGNLEYLKMAKKSKDYVLANFFDEIFEGTYWKITYDGKPADTKKQIYSQAFFIYALSEYYRASGDKQCLDKAISLYHLIENKSFDKKLNGYFEAFSREWKLLEDLRLSNKDANEKKTTNTHLHILEAYANLYRIWKDEELGRKLSNLVNIFLDRIIDPVTHHMLLFFDESWNSKSSLVSYGHDIEASWLVYDAALALDDKKLIEKAKPLCIALGVAALEGLQDDGSLIYEKDEKEGIHDMDRHWWPQAETVVGLLNLFELSGNKQHFLQALDCWDYITQKLVDHENGEWYWSIKSTGEPNLTEDKAGFWKCPYHNARACIEAMSRCEKMIQAQV